MKNQWLNLLIYTLLISINLILNASSTNLIVSILQYIIVFYYLLKKDLKRAVFLHFLFLVTSPSLLGFDDLEIKLSYNYAKMKLYGNFSFSLLVSFLLFIVSYIKRPVIPDQVKVTLFYKLYEFIFIIGSIGFVFGIFGLAFLSYYIEGFIGYFSYIFVVFINASILIYNYSDKLIKKFYQNSILILAASPIASILLFTLGFSREHYGQDSFYSSELSFFSVILLAGLFHEKKIATLILSLTCFFTVLLMAISGKAIFLFFIVLTVCIFLSNDSQIKKKYKIRTEIFTGVVIIFFLLSSVFLTYIYSNDKYIFLQTKIYQFTSMFNVFYDGLDSVANSPYVRLASLTNIMYEHIQNPITFIFGNGYGGYYEDHFNFFSIFESLEYAFPDESVKDGKFYYGHDTLVTVPFLNGLLGLFLLLSIVFKYIKAVKKNFLSLACIPFLLLAFYFNTQFGIIGVMLLFASEWRINAEKQNSLS